MSFRMIILLTGPLAPVSPLFLSNSIVRDAASDSPQIQFDMVAARQCEKFKLE